MNSSGPNQSEINSDKAATKPGNVETETRCVYPNERRERKQIYTLLSISNSVNEQEERPLEGANGTGWEEAVQSWSKTAPFAYLQLQKRTRKSKTSESVNRCLYCLDLTPGVEPEPQNMVQVKSDFKLNPSAASGGPPEKQQTLLYSSSVTTTTTAAATPPPATDEPKRETDYSKLHSIEMSQGEKKRMALREAQASLSEKKLFLLKENLLFPAEKKPVPIKEYNILSPGKPQSLATVKTKEIRSHEPLLWNRSGTEITAKSSLVLPPLKDTALKHSLDNSAKKSKVVNSQASEKTFHAFAETVSCPQFLKPKQLKCEPTIDAMYDAVVKEQLKMHEIASAFVPRLSKTSLLSRHLDRGYWHFLPDRKSLTLSSSVQLRRHGHLHSSHSLHAKGSHASKANEIRRSYNGGKQEGSQAKSQDIPLLSGLFSSLTEPSWERVTPFICCKTPKQPKKSRITQPTSRLPRQSMSQSLKKNVSRGTNQQPSLDCKFPEGGPIASSTKAGVSCFKPYTYIPTMNANPEGERVRGKLDSIQTFLGEKRTLPIKEYEITYSQRAEQEVLSMPNASQGHPASSLDCITLNALLVLQPETGVINLHLEPPPKPKAVAVKRSDKGHGASTRVVSRSCAAKEAKEKNQNKVDIDHMVKKQIQKSCTAL
ncbi:uncharacterized protein C16orf46 homolog [Notechis scutatus]|uniref:Uncharacterized protein C16orf46 homolog n=1 Tax=Notechis scutatus TaxID=8663 RepID=A0A6J1UIT4_9SAUR|nr:uncharacterized protein C16orf46 homolog [Notechis scutatus]